MFKDDLPIPSSTSHLPERTGREARQQIERIKAGLAVARQIDIARARRVGGITEHVQTSAALLCARQVLLTQLVPEAAGCLQLVTQTGVMGMASVVKDVAEQ